MAKSGSSSNSKTQLDLLGERLRLGTHTEDDLRQLDDYRRSFRTAYETAAAAIRKELGAEATGREAKTTAAISAKLKRQKIRLTQIQDIAGLRIVVADLHTQDILVGKLMFVFGGASVDDRRKRPSHGYRAVHVIAKIDGKSVEIQVRTQEQHLWAELSERISDRIHSAIKYGGGPKEIQSVLGLLSDGLSSVEAAELKAQEAEDFFRSAQQRLATGAVADQSELRTGLAALEADVVAFTTVVNTRKRSLRELMGALLILVRAESEQP